jgi:hypothetical protein
MTLDTILASVDPSAWQLHQAVVFDWYDGPREGVAALAYPSCEFYFELLCERPTADDLDDRLFRLSELPSGTVADLVAALQGLGKPNCPVWAPNWQFANAREKEAADRKLDEYRQAKRASRSVVRTSDMTQFRGYWRISDDAAQAPDLFKRLKIA